MSGKARARRTFLALLLLAGCAAAPTRPTGGAGENSDAAALLAKAEAYQRNNFLGKALETYVGIVELWPKSPQAPAAAYRAGSIHQQQNAFDKAIFYYELLASRFPDSPQALEAHFQVGVCRRALGQHEQATVALSYYINVAGAKRADEARLLLADSCAQLKKWDEALIAYAAGVPRAERAEQVEAMKAVRRILEDEINTPKLLTLLPRLAPGPVLDFGRYHAAQELVRQGRRPEAVRLLHEIDYAKKPYKFYEKAAALLEAAEAPGAPSAPLAPETAKTPDMALAPTPSAAKRAVGVILPLTGADASFGQEVLQGIMQAVDVFGAGGGTAFRAVLRDDQGDPDTAAKFVNELADDPEVMAIIGPLMGKCAEKATIEAEKRGIPLIALTPRENALGPGQWTFRNFLTASAQVRALIQYATQHQGSFRFAVLYPDNPAGRLFRDLFRDNLDQSRYRLVASVSYSPAETDFKRAIAQLQAHGSFDALFIPDGAREIALLAPQLVYYGVKDTLLLGTSSWNSDELSRQAGNYLSRAVFVDAFFARSRNNSEAAGFVSRYEDAFHRPPSLLAAVGYDTARLAVYALGRRADIDRDGVRRELLRVHDFPGATGELTVGENRDVQRRLFLLRVGAQQIEELF
jgi:ABC-type branched-subunit amino acid transport system substrate-binding protein/outer membrane protein assembly factor BamD (BamD/ComL family)